MSGKIVRRNYADDHEGRGGALAEPYLRSSIEPASSILLLGAAEDPKVTNAN
jgi:hypothetical protein